MKSLLIIAGCAALGAALGYSLIALTNDHDPGQVFPVAFQELLFAVLGGVIGILIGSVAAYCNYLFRWW